MRSNGWIYNFVPLLLFTSLVVANRIRFDAGETCAWSSLSPLIYPSCARSLQRHVDEKQRLLTRLDRKTGKWDKNHPRWRLLDALWGFQDHYDANLRDNERLRGLYMNVSKEQRKITESSLSYTKKLSKNDHLAYVNSRLESAIIAHALAFYYIESSELEKWIYTAKKEGRKPDKISTSQGMKHYVRDWSGEGASERRETFECVLGMLDGAFPRSCNHDGDVRTRKYATEAGDRKMHGMRVLLPGAGLGRLGYDIEQLGGFEVTLNEWSSYMLLAYRFITSIPTQDAIVFHPFIDSWSHHARTADMQRPVSFPDVQPYSTSPFSLAASTPSSIAITSAPLMIEGDFTTSFLDSVEATYSGSFDAVITLFFIDTARSLYSYFIAIYKLLPIGGIWLNFGPLLYGTAPFIQLSVDEIVALAEGIGFEFLEIADLTGKLKADRLCGPLTFREGEAGVRSKGASYAFNTKALHTNRYWAQGFVARKVR